MNLLPWVGLVGVALGFFLGEGSRYARYRWDIHHYKSLVKAELISVLAQLPQKRDILQQAIGHMQKEKFMPTLSVRMVATGYYLVLEKLYPHLSPIERNCLHVIFERLRVADEQLDDLENAFFRTIKDGIVASPWSKFSGRLVW